MPHYRKEKTSPLDGPHRLGTPYGISLRAGLNLLSGWLQLQPSIPSLESTLWRVDEFLERFVKEMHQQKKRFYVVRNALLGIHSRFPRLRGELPGAWAALGRWERSRPWKPRIPISKELMLFVFLIALDAAEKVEKLYANRWRALAVLVRVAFFGLMRPGEVFRLRKCDISFVETAQGDLVAVLAISQPKSRWVRGAGRSQFTTVRDRSTALWLKAWCATLKDPDKIWPDSRSTMVQWLSMALSRAEIHRLGLTWGCFRPGGATWELISGCSMEAISFHGRWISVNSLRSYLQEAGSFLVWSRVDQVAQERCQDFLHRYRTILAAPPPSWPG